MKRLYAVFCSAFVRPSAAISVVLTWMRFEVLPLNPINYPFVAFINVTRSSRVIAVHYRIACILTVCIYGDALVCGYPISLSSCLIHRTDNPAGVKLIKLCFRWTYCNNRLLAWLPKCRTIAEINDMSCCREKRKESLLSKSSTNDASA